MQVARFVLVSDFSLLCFGFPLAELIYMILSGSGTNITGLYHMILGSH